MLSLAQPNFTSLTQSHTLYFVHFLAYVISVISHMCRIPQPQHYKAAAGENGDFVFALISRRLKLHSWNFRFRKLTYDINGKICHISAMGVYGTGRTSVAKTCPHNGKRKSQNFLCILKNWARCNLEFLKTSVLGTKRPPFINLACGSMKKVVFRWWSHLHVRLCVFVVFYICGIKNWLRD